MNVPNDQMPGGTPEVPATGIVSVNNRGGAGGNPLGKVFFVVGVLGLILVAGFYGFNKYRANEAEKAAAAKQTNKNESKPAAAGIVRDFDKEQAAAAAPAVAGTTAAAGPCADGSAGVDAVGPDDRPDADAGRGVAEGVPGWAHCRAEHQRGTADPCRGEPAQGTPRPSRYAGDAIIASSGSGAAPLASLATDPAAQAAYVASLVNQGTVQCRASRPALRWEPTLSARVPGKRIIGLAIDAFVDAPGTRQQCSGIGT